MRTIIIAATIEFGRARSQARQIPRTPRSGKHDGFRATVFIENSECRLVSRNLKNRRFESLKVALARLLCGMPSLTAKSSALMRMA